MKTEIDNESNQVPEPLGPRGAVILAVTLLVAFALRAYRLTELPGGFLAFNELFYIDAALKQAASAPFSWFVNPVNWDKPPLYTGVVSMLYALQMPHLAAARLVSVLAGTLTVLVTFLMASRFYCRRTAFIAAAALAVMPGVVLVDHNIQVDPLFVSLLYSAVLLYAVSIKRENGGYPLYAGVVLGLSILAKQVAVLVVPAVVLWELWRSRGWSGLLTKRFVIFSATSVAIGASWYILQLIVAKDRLIAGHFATGARSEMTTKGAGFWLKAVPLEISWMVFPAATVVVMAGLAIMLRERRQGDRLLLALLAIFMLYYAQFHLHSYYLLPMAPIFAIAVGRGWAGIFQWSTFSVRIGTGLISLLLTAMLVGSLLTLSGHKWGRWSPLALSGEPAISSPVAQLYIDPGVTGFLGPFEGLLGLKNRPVILDMEQYMRQPPTSGDNSVILVSGPPQDYPISIPYRYRSVDVRCRPVMFGYAVGQWPATPSATQIFRNAPWTAERVGPLWRFGFIQDRLPGKWAIFDRSTLVRLFGS